MPMIRFTANLQRHVDCPDMQVEGQTVAEVLRACFAANPRAQGYVLDERGAVRRHVVIFIDGEPIEDRAAQSDAVEPTSEIYIFQALSGG